MTRAPASPASSAESELRVPAHASRLPEVAAFAGEQARRARMGETATARLRLILEELFCNVCSHGSAGGADAPHWVRIRCELRAQDALLHTTFSDTAPAFDPLASPAPQAHPAAPAAPASPASSALLTPPASPAPQAHSTGTPSGTLLPLEDLPVGGQGLHLVRTLAVEPRYARVGEHNTFTFSLALL